jgi:hypothetical protein
MHASLPYLLGTVISAALAGAVVSCIGLYWHIVFLSPAFTSIGFGLMYTFSSTMPDSKVIGYQVCSLVSNRTYIGTSYVRRKILASLGMGCLLQNTMIALQACFFLFLMNRWLM